VLINIGADVWVAFCGACGRNDRARLGRYEGITYILAPGFIVKPNTPGVYELSRRARRKEQQGLPRQRYKLRHAPTHIQHEDGAWHIQAPEIDEQGNTTKASLMIRPPCLIVCPVCRIQNQIPEYPLPLAIGGQ
jgi:hypothetical protein